MYINKNFSTLLLKVLNLVKYNKRFRNFCVIDEIERVYQKLVKVTELLS